MTETSTLNAVNGVEGRAGGPIRRLGHRVGVERAGGMIELRFMCTHMYGTVIVHIYTCLYVWASRCVFVSAS